MTTTERSPKPDAQHNQRAQIPVARIVLSFVGLSVGWITGFVGVFRRVFSSSSDASTRAFFWTMLVAVAVAAVSALVLLVEAILRLHPARRQSVGASVTSMSCLLLLAVTLGPPLAWAIPDFHRLQERLSRPLTATESSISLDELTTTVQELVDRTTGVTGVDSTHDAVSLTTESCVLSNTSSGRRITTVTSEHSELPTDPQAALDAVAALWRDRGYEPLRAPESVALVDEDGPVEFVRLGYGIPRFGTSSEFSFELLSICVPE